MSYYNSPSLNAFTPKEFSQNIFGSDKVTITKDPLYLQLTHKKACKLCNKLGINVKPSTDEQASAIIAVVTSLDKEQAKELCEFILQSETDERAKHFVNVVNTTHDVCAYLPNVTGTKQGLHRLDQLPQQLDSKKYRNTYILTKDNELYYVNGNKAENIPCDKWVADKIRDYKSNESFVSLPPKVHEKLIGVRFEYQRPDKKTDLIAKHSTEYKKDIFVKNYKFLTKEYKNEKEIIQAEQQLKQEIKTAEKKFRYNALDIDRGFGGGFLRKAGKLLINVITHVSIVGMLINWHHKKETGSWLLFDKTRSAAAVKTIRQNNMEKCSSMRSELLGMKNAATAKKVDKEVLTNSGSLSSTSNRKI